MRHKGEGTIGKLRPDGRRPVAITLPNGKRRWGYVPKGGSMADAVALLDRMRRDAIEGTRSVRSETLGTFLRRWLTDVQPTIRPLSYRQHEMIVRVHLLPALGSIRLADLTAADVRSYLRSKSRTLAPMTVRHHRATLRRALGDAPLAVNVAAGRKAGAPKVERPEWHVLTAEQVSAFLGATAGSRLHALWTLGFTVGLRQEELLGLTWQNVDLDAATLRVALVLQRVDRDFQLRRPKTEWSLRSVSLPETAVAALRGHRARQNAERLSQGVGGTYDGLVFTAERRRGRPIHGSVATTSLYRALAGAGIDRQGMTFHGMRHTCATILLAAGWSLEDVKQLLGHSSIRVTSDFYSHRSEARSREVAAGMDRLLEGAR